MPNTSETVSVAIVGAGPTGIAAAILLRQKGVQATIFERKSGTCQLPQAHVINTRTSEILREMDLFDDVAAAAARPERAAFVTWSGALKGPRFGRLDYQGDSAQIAERRQASPAQTLNIGQDRFERLLLDKFLALGGEVRFGHEVVGAAIDGSGRAILEVAAAGSPVAEEIFDYVFACDGSNSLVRRELGIEMEGPPSLARFASAYFRGNLDPYLGGDCGPVHFIAGPDVRGAIIGFDISEVWAFMCVIPPDGNPADFTPEVMDNLVRRAIGDAEAAIEITSVGSWNMSAQVAERFAQGPFFLLGDAAHRFPPTGGLGLNTGFGDAHNIAWKLAMVARGDASAALLESYDRERRPVAIRNRDHSVSNAMRMSEVDAAIGLPTLAPVDAAVANAPVGAMPRLSEDQLAEVQRRIDDQRAHFDSLQFELGYCYGEAAGREEDDEHDFRPLVRLGGRLPHAWLKGVPRRSTLDLAVGDRFSLLAGASAEDWRTRFASNPLLPIMVVEVGDLEQAKSGQNTTALSAQFSDSILVRPDGHVAWVGPSDPDDDAVRQIEDAISELIGKGVSDVHSCPA